MKVADAFRRFRKDFGLTKTAVATTLGVKLPAYKYETEGLNNGKDVLPNASTLIKLALAYDVSIDYLVGLTDDPTPRWKVDAAPASVKDATPEVQSPPASAPTEMTVDARLDRLERALTAAGIELK